MEIFQTDNDKGGVFYIEEAGERLAEMTYLHSEKNKISIDHTEVSEKLRGKGVGYKLVDAAVSYSRVENLKLASTCSFAGAILKKKHEEYKDVLF